ncbi:MAG: hypothetical protein EHM79_00175 [Geobacter sp.]|nr:MAG: hypothetical protein EHM79_00175 [Geobacter sp.]
MSNLVDIIKISNIIVADRAREDYADIKDLTEKIRVRGLIQPIAVKELSGGKYLLLAGGRRLAACKRLVMETIPARVFPGDLTEVDEKEVELSENIDRKDLSLHERWKLEKAIHDLYMARAGGPKVSKAPGAPGHSLRDTAKLLGKSHQQIATHVMLATAMEESPEMKQALSRVKTDKDAIKVLRAANKIIEASENRKRVEAGYIPKVHKDLMEAFNIGDAFEGLSSVEDKSINILEIDPPYGIDLLHNKKSQTSAGVQNITTYEEVEESDYSEFIDRLLSIASTKLSEDGWLILWFAVQYYEMIKTAIENHGLIVCRTPGIWVKPQGQTNRPDTLLASCYESFFYARKANSKINKQGMKNTFLYNMVPPQFKVHPAERPIEMIECILQTFANPSSKIKVAVPFCGSGNTLLAAANLGMIGIGWDNSQQYKDAFVQRVVAGKPPNYKSYS